MDPIPPGLRERKKLQTRLGLARAAISLFEERGYAATTVEDIAAAANVSRRTFFRYFRSKDEVLIIDPEGRLAVIHDAFAEVPPDEPTLDKLSRGMVALTEACCDPELTRSLMALRAREPEIRAAAMANDVRIADALTHELALDMGLDERFDPRPRILACTVITLMRTAVAEWMLDGDEGGETPIEKAVRAFELGRPTLEATMAMPVAVARKTG